MAKFANVTYGTQGNTAEYTYVVNDNVRTGDYIHPSVKHHKSGKIFGTTAIIQSTAKETSKAGKAIIQDLQQRDKPIEPVKAYTGKEVGAQRDRGEGGKFGKGSGLPKTYRDEETGRRKAPDDYQFTQSQYIRQARQGNVEARKQYESQQYESFDSYSNKFMNNGGEQ